MDHSNQNNSDAPSGQAGYMKLAGVDDQEYDALADLFLGQSELAPKPISGTGTDPIEHAPCRTVAPPQQEPDPAARALELVENVQMHINESSGSGSGSGSGDSVARASLGGVAGARLTSPRIEAVLLGHLPVRASLWVRQYACSTARRRGEIVALIRAAAGSTSVDLICGGQDIQSKVCSSLNEALVLVDQIADRVILRVDETTEPDLLEREELDEIAILTGADEAAIVASYRLIKTLTSVWDSDEMLDTPHLRLAVMGATGQQVADASAKLTRAVDAFLDRPIEIVDAAGRIDATGTTNIFRDTVAHQAMDILDELVSIGSDESSFVGGLGLSIPEPALVETPEVVDFKPAAFKPAALEPAALEPAALEPVALEPAVAEPAAPEKICPAGDQGLGVLIEGLTRLETRCPFALDVELCIDPEGSLHLVADDDHDGPMARLETVRAWVRDHLPLILRAEPGLAFPDADDRSSEIELHLIASDPQSLRGLIDSPVRMYALAEVSAGGQTVRVATSIN